MATIPKRYRIIRFYENKSIRPRFEDGENYPTGLTLEEAKHHCKSESSSGDGWFDGFTEINRTETQADIVLTKMNKCFHENKRRTSKTPLY